MKTAPGLSDISGQQSQGDEATGVVGAVDVLGDAHAPEDDGAPGAAEESRHLSNPRSRKPANGGSALGGIARDGRLKFLEGLRVFLDVGTIREILLDDRVHDGVVESDVGAWLDSAVEVGVVSHLSASRVDDDQLGSVLPSLLEEGRRHGMVGCGVGAGDQGRFGV